MTKPNGLDRSPATMLMPTYFYEADTNEPIAREDDERPLPLNIGDGYVSGDGDRYRVVDRFFSMERHAPMEMGTHLWLRKINKEVDDLPHLINPDYYRS